MSEPATPGDPKERLLTSAVDYLATHGVHDQSLRGLASALGTSHRMLIYHFGSREGLLAEVVRVVEAQQRDALSTMLADVPDGLRPREAGLRFWSYVVGPALTYGPLFFELSAHAMQHRPYAAPLRETLVEAWLDPLTELLGRSGGEPAEARTRARLGLGVARGLLFDLLVGGDRAEVDEAMRLFVDLLEPAWTPRADRAAN